MRRTYAILACASALQHAPHHCRSRRRNAAPDGDNDKWNVDVDEFAERIESAKAAVVGGLAASVAASPAEFLTHTNNIAQFEFDVDQISIMGALFGLVFRSVWISNFRRPAPST